MGFDPSRLPEPRSFWEREDVMLKGRGPWCTGPCHLHGGSDSMRVNVVVSNWRCMACEAKGGDVLSYYMQRHGVGFVEACKALGAWTDDDDGSAQMAGKPASRPTPPRRTCPEPKYNGLSPYGQQVWRETLAIAEETAGVFNVARAYLEAARGCVLPPLDSDLRWHPNLRHWPTGYVGPALVGLVRHALTGEAMSLLRGWMNADGSKPDIEPQRMLLGSHHKTDGVVKLWPDEAVTTGLGVCEGVESALSLAHGFKPVWACIDAGNLAQFPVLDGIDYLVIGADHDEAGIKAAERCMARWKAAGREAAVVMPREPKYDLNDLARVAA